ncbi:unnamed protein product [Lepeophtheirus salmonis]|uniref:(salmon louse) hypothetical protein n=1 Tax=Lepeophtheirus salmonis TaxID=72036 RepID=A0A7R8CQ74_LEPSM|nr:unnamed protein product [Lepeophtheirus salmonis]CAF2854942.1 unnamed protein product [Lepeophtheirus salmonis]
MSRSSSSFVKQLWLTAITMDLKSGIIALTLFFTLLQFTLGNEVNQRNCPNGYQYAGEDSSNNRIYIPSKSENDVTYFDAVKGCSDEENHVENKARLISFDDDFNEIQRFANILSSYLNGSSSKILTSGLKLPNYSTFVWSSTNEMYNISEAFIQIQNKTDPKLACLALSINSPHDFTLEAIDCANTNIKTYVCEVRVQIVTFYAWFVNNSWNLVLLFSISILGIGLCMSGFAYRSSPRFERRVQRRPGNVSPAGPNISKIDAPPPYESFVNAQCAHEGLPPKYDSNAQAPSRLEQIKNKGKDILATVTVFKTRY